MFAVAVGSGLLAYATLALGLLGLLYPWLFLALAGAAGVALRAELVPILRGLAAARRLLRRPATWGPAPAGWVAAVGVVCGAVLLCVALLPPFAYDALWYHLAAPQVFVQQHRFVALPLLGQANFPFTVEMLSTIGLLFGSDAGSAVLEFAAGAGLLVATWSFAARWFDRRVAWIAVAGLLTASDLHKLAAIADIDLALALFQFLALYAAMLWIERRQMGWLVLSALLAGLAAGSKYTALAALPLPALLVLSADGLRPRQWLANARPALALVGLALAVAAPWYLKNLVLYHNPFYPMLAGSLLDPALGLPAAPATAPAPRGLAWLLLLPLRVLQSGDNLSLTGRGLGDYLHLPLQVYLTGDLEMYGRPSLLFALAPLAFLAGRRPIVARLAAAAALESVVWALGPQELRYLAPAFPLYALLAAAAFDHLAARLGSPRLARLRLLMPLLALLSLTVVEDGYLFAAMNPLPVLAGAQSPAAFLGRVDTSYGAYRYLAGVLHPGERVLAIGEDRGYYAHIPILLDNSRDMAARVFVVPGSAQASAALLARARIAYVLVNDQDVQFQARVAPEEARREAAAFDQFSQRYLVEVYGAPGMHVYRFDAT